MSHDLYIGGEAIGHADHPQEYLLTVWEDGTHELARRPAGSGATWSPPLTLAPQPATPAFDRLTAALNSEVQA